MTPFTSVKDNLHTLSFKLKGDLQNDRDFLNINHSPDGSNWECVDDRTGTAADFTQGLLVDLVMWSFGSLTLRDRNWDWPLQIRSGSISI